VSARPRWEEGARTYVQFLGAPETVYAPYGTPSDDIVARSRWAAWENVAGVDDSVYVSWHTNAPSPGRGTVSYIYSPNAPDGTYDDSHAVAGSAELMNLIHDEVVGDIRALWDPTWNDYGYQSAFFGEINPTHNDEMPSCMIIVAFHATQADAEALKEPRFARLVARAVVQGIIRYFAQRDMIATDLPPEPPREVEVRATDGTSAVVTWSPPVSGGAYGDPATSYRVYQSAGGEGFDNGTDTAQTSLTLTGLTPGVPRYVRVSSVNDGGESLPSETLVVTPGASGEPRVVVVNGFDRLDRFMLVSTDLSAYSLGTVQRMFLDPMNTFDYVIEHAEALRSLDVVVDSASNEALVGGRRAIDPATDDAVVWILGTESTADETFSDAEQSLLAAYLAAGGTLLVSGAELGWDLVANGSGSDQAFYDTTLRAHYVADDAGVHLAEGVPGSIFDGVPPIPFDDGTFGGYDVKYPDVVAPRTDAALCATYDGSSDGACLEVDTGTYRVVYLAFPFESITSGAVRADVMAAAMSFLVPPSGPIFADGFESGDTTSWSVTTP
jgi:hypothetical protein